MPVKPAQFRPKSWKQYDSRSKESLGYRKLYNTYRWRTLRARFIQQNPTCVMCMAEGKVGLAEIVDHIVPHRGDEKLFFDVSNWQPLCKMHHDKDKQRAEQNM